MLQPSFTVMSVSVSVMVMSRSERLVAVFLVDVDEMHTAIYCTSGKQ